MRNVPPHVSQYCFEAAQSSSIEHINQAKDILDDYIPRPMLTLWLVLSVITFVGIAIVDPIPAIIVMALGSLSSKTIAKFNITYKVHFFLYFLLCVIFNASYFLIFAFSIGPTSNLAIIVLILTVIDFMLTDCLVLMGALSRREKYLKRHVLMKGNDFS